MVKCYSIPKEEYIHSLEEHLVQDARPCDNHVLVVNHLASSIKVGSPLKVFLSGLVKEPTQLDKQATSDGILILLL